LYRRAAVTALIVKVVTLAMRAEPAEIFMVLPAE